jgi:hypothetical protein
LTAPPDEVRRTVHDVLAQREFRQPPRSLLERARTWAIEEFSRVLDSMFRGGRGSVIAWSIVAVALVVLGLLVARFVRRTTADPEVTAALAPRHRRSSAEWLSEAAAHEALGEWRDGMRCRYRALVADLVDRGVLDDVPGRTAGEYRSELAGRTPVVAPDFSGASELFERAWYGGIDTGPDEASDFDELAGRVRTGARR